jgi:sulfate permease, SulP family
LQALMDGEKRLTELGAVFWMMGLNPGVLQMVRHAGFDERLGRERILFNVQAAIEHYQALEAAPATNPG